MTDSPATASESPESSKAPEGARNVYMGFWFVKIHHEFSTLMTNEKVVARQEFLETYDQFPHRMPVALYGVDGFSAKADIMIWRVSPDLEDFHVMSTRLRRSGFGRYLLPSRSYTGVVPAADYPFEPRRKGSKDPGPIGNRRFLIVASVAGDSVAALRAAAAGGPGRLHLLDGRGLDREAWVAAYETDDPSSFSSLLSNSIPGRAPAAIACVRKEAHDLIESAG